MILELGLSEQNTVKQISISQAYNGNLIFKLLLIFNNVMIFIVIIDVVQAPQKPQST